MLLGAPVVRDVATALKLPPKRYLMPLSYVTVLTGCCALIGTSTNLLVDDMARVAGQPRFGMFEITPVKLPMALAGAPYLFLFSGKLMRGSIADTAPVSDMREIDVPGAQVGDSSLFEQHRPFQPVKAAMAFGVFVGAIAIAAAGIAPIAASAFAGAVLLMLLRVITAAEAYGGLRPQI